MPKTLAKILIVEDEAIVAEDLCIRLQRMGYQIIGAADSGQKALVMCEQYQPDLILMDIVLKGNIDGIATAETIKDKYCIPIVFLTAYGDQDTFRRAKDTQPFGYITKPFQQKDLQITVEIALQRYEIETQIRQELSQIQHEKPVQIQENLLPNQSNQSNQRHEFVSMAVHEMRNPLTVLLAATKLLEVDPNQTKEEVRAKYFRLIESSGNKLEKLIDEMLILEKLSSKQQEFQPQVVNISDFLHDLLEQIKVMHLNQQPTHELIMVCSQHLGSVMLDTQLLQHILQNLITNAIKYSPQGGKITLEIIYQEQEEATIPPRLEMTSLPYPRLVFQVQDQGIGIPTADQNKIFRAFSRCSNVNRIKGTGLGLAIVKHAVELHGGAISFVSTEGVGSTFTVVLPYGSV